MIFVRPSIIPKNMNVKVAQSMMAVFSVTDLSLIFIPFDPSKWSEDAVAPDNQSVHVSLSNILLS